MKYIIEIAKEYEEYFKGILICGIAEGKFAVDVIAKEDLEELTADYISKHFSDLQDDAYHRGLAEGKKAFDLLDAERDSEYQRGLDDAWEAARKVGHCKLWDDYTKDTGKPSVCAVAVLDHYTAYEAIEKLKAYEEKQKADDKIEVGDEVEWDNDFTGDRFIVTRIYQPYGKKEQCDGIDDDGDVYRAVLIESLVKTGRHFDIASILKEMQS